MNISYWGDFLISISSVLAAVIFILGFIYKLRTRLLGWVVQNLEGELKRILREDIGKTATIVSMSAENKQQNESLLNIEKSVCKMILHTSTIDNLERLEAGERYIALGGNSATKLYYEELLTEVRSNISTDFHEGR
jgi:hypothetical protein